MLHAKRYSLRHIRCITGILVSLYLGLTTISLGQAEDITCEKPLTFTFWGSPQEKSAVEAMVKNFNDVHPGIQIKAQHIPNNGYAEKISTMVAGQTSPDIAYLGADRALPWVEEGTLLDLAPLYASDASVKSQMDFMKFYAGDKVSGVYTAPEIQVLYYNRDLFDKAGVTYPPANAADAWTWAEFVDIAKQLTLDKNGNNASSPDFDAKNIDVYGFSFPTWYAGWLSFVVSNNGSLVNEDGTEITLNQPEAVEALQAMQDLIYVDHVSPSPTQSEAFPSADVMMQTGKVAMTMEGHWKVLDFSQIPNLNWGLAVLPIFQKPATQMTSAATSIFASTSCPDGAWEFLKWHNDPQYVDLLRKGCGCLYKVNTTRMTQKSASG